MKRAALVLSIVLTILLLSGCAQQEESDTGPEFFKLIEQNWTYSIMYDATTGVMYTVSDGTYNRGNFTLLVNADGTPRIWDGWK